MSNSTTIQPSASKSASRWRPNFFHWIPRFRRRGNNAEATDNIQQQAEPAPEVMTYEHCQVRVTTHYSQLKNDESAQESTLDPAIQALEEFLRRYNPELSEQGFKDLLVDDTTKNQVAWALASLGKLCSYEQSIRFKKYPGREERYQEFGFKLRSYAAMLDDKESIRFLYKHKLATALGHFTVGAIYAVLIVGTFMMVSALLISAPLAIVAAAGTAIVCTGHWLGFNYWDKIYNRLHYKFADTQLVKWLGTLPGRYVPQGSPSEQMRNVYLFLWGATPADTVEAKRAARYAQLPIFAFTTVFVISAVLFLSPAFPLAWLTGIAIFIGLASAHANYRVFLGAFLKWAKKHASTDGEVNNPQDHKLQRKVALYSSIVWGSCVTLTMMVVGGTALFTLIASVATGGLFIPAVLLMSPVFAALAYASIAIGRGYTKVSIATWENNIDTDWDSLNLTKPLKKYKSHYENNDNPKIGLIEKVFGGIGFGIAILVAISLTILSIMEFKTFASLIPSTYGWLGLGGPIGLAGGLGTSVLYVTDIVIVFRTAGHNLARLFEKQVGQNQQTKSALQTFADSPFDIKTVYHDVAAAMRKGLTLLSSSSGSAVQSAVPVMGLLSGAIVGFIFVPTAVVLAIAVPVMILAGLASLSVIYVNWQESAEKYDAAQPAAERPDDDRHAVNSLIKSVLQIPSNYVVAPIIVGVIGFAKLVARAIVGVQRWANGEENRNIVANNPVVELSPRKQELPPREQFKKATTKGPYRSLLAQTPGQPQSANDTHDTPVGLRIR